MLTIVIIQFARTYYIQVYNVHSESTTLHVRHITQHRRYKYTTTIDQHLYREARNFNTFGK